MHFFFELQVLQEIPVFKVACLPTFLLKVLCSKYEFSSFFYFFADCWPEMYNFGKSIFGYIFISISKLISWEQTCMFHYHAFSTSEEKFVNSTLFFSLLWKKVILSFSKSTIDSIMKIWYDSQRCIICTYIVFLKNPSENLVFPLVNVSFL